MNTAPAWVYMLLAVGVPFLLGAVVGWLLRERSSRLGLPWGLLPGGGLLKKLWESIE